MKRPIPRCPDCGVPYLFDNIDTWFSIEAGFVCFCLNCGSSWTFADWRGDDLAATLPKTGAQP